MKKLDVVFILDKSGSMSGSENNTISSFNEYLEKEKKNDFKTYITTVLFSDSYKYLHNGIDVKKVKKISEKDYKVGGCTALYDAVGNTINKIEKKDTDKVLFIIITDGYENASKEYHIDDIKKMIKKNKDYEFIFLGADIDSYMAGSSIGIKKTNIANFKKDKKCTNILFGAVGCFEKCMMSGKASSSWKQELDEYLEENEK